MSGSISGSNGESWNSYEARMVASTVSSSSVHRCAPRGYSCSTRRSEKVMSPPEARMPHAPRAFTSTSLPRTPQHKISNPLARAHRALLISQDRGNCIGEERMDIKSPSVGKVLRMSVEVGAQVARGSELMVIESMKGEIPIKATAAGRLKEFRVKPGDQIQRNAVLAVIEA